MEILLSINPNYLSRIILIVIMTTIECYCYYIFFRWIMIKDEVQKRQAVGRLTCIIVLLMMIAIFIEIVEKYLGMIGIYVNIIIGGFIVRRQIVTLLKGIYKKLT